jgi:recombination protein RecT
MTTNAISVIDSVRSTLTKMQPEFAAALPPQIPAEKFIRTTVTAIQMQPDLLQADRRSLLGACMKAAQDGLLPDGREAALVIFRGKGGAQVQYMPMIGGLLKKLRNSGELASISAHVVHEHDQFDYILGDEERIEHKPCLFGDRGQPIAVYAVAKTKDGAVYREVMSVEEVEKVRSVSRAGNSGPWVAWWGEMAKKTVIRRLCKRLPSSADLDQVIAHDNENYDLSQATRPMSQERTRRSRLHAAILPAEQLKAPADDQVVEQAEADEEREAIVAEASGEVGDV